LFIGGDVLSVPAVKKAVKALRNTRIVNGSGPTDNTTFTTVHEVKATQPLKNSVPIGRPILNTQVYLLDPHLQLVPVGVPGELYTGGDGLALGYIGQPRLTEERFIQHPKFGRLYSTGDLCVWNPAGEIEFLRRLIKGAEREIFLIVDRGPAHRAKKVSDFVQTLSGKLRLFFLPPYSPDRNPDELVWKHLKADTVGRMAVTSKEDFAKKVRQSMLDLQNDTRKIISFYQKPSLQYAA
jgi:acyl-CoA synthetase (AMP-forming)/AMP-acid ligase II